jgi:hypothetical protein
LELLIKKYGMAIADILLRTYEDTSGWLHGRRGCSGENHESDSKVSLPTSRCGGHRGWSQVLVATAWLWQRKDRDRSECHRSFGSGRRNNVRTIAGRKKVLPSSTLKLKRTMKINYCPQPVSDHGYL